MTGGANEGPAPDLAGAKAVIDAAQGVVDRAAKHLAASGSIDDQQVVAYDLAHSAAAVAAGRAMLAYGEKGDTEARLACAYVADAIAELAGRMVGRSAQWGVDPVALAEAEGFVSTYRDPAFVAPLALEQGPRHLDP